MQFPGRRTVVANWDTGTCRIRRPYRRRRVQGRTYHMTPASAARLRELMRREEEIQLSHKHTPFDDWDIRQAIIGGRYE